MTTTLTHQQWQFQHFDQMLTVATELALAQKRSTIVLRDVRPIFVPDDYAPAKGDRIFGKCFSNGSVIHLHCLLF